MTSKKENVDKFQSYVSLNVTRIIDLRYLGNYKLLSTDNVKQAHAIVTNMGENIQSSSLNVNFEDNLQKIKMPTMCSMQCDTFAEVFKINRNEINF